MVDFNTTFPVSEGAGIQINLAFSNTILTNSSGVEQRIVRWQDPIRTYNFARRILTVAELNSIQNFFNQTQGAASSFLYFDRSDNSDYGTGYLYPMPDGNRTQFQLVKLYTVGPNVHFRVITQPKTITKINGLTTGWTLGSNGQITMATPPAAGSWIPAQYTFYVPVTFDSDELQFRLVGPNTYQIDRLLLRELKQEPYLYPLDYIHDSPSSGTQQTIFPTGLDFLANNQALTEYDTEVITLSSGYRKRTSRLSIPFFKQTLSERKTFNSRQHWQLLNFWLANKGNGLLWYYPDLSVSGNTLLARFNSQELTYALTSVAGVYDISPIELKVYREGTILADYPMESPADILSNPLCTLARVCNISVPLPSGSTQSYGFTTADRDITIGGQVYKANTAFEPTALQKSANLTVDNEEIKTIISSDAITEEQLASGYFDKAIITVATVDYTNPPNSLDGAIVEQKGITGQISSTDTQYTIENLTLNSSLIRQNVNWHTSPFCRWDFCDTNPNNINSHCTLDINNYRWTANIINPQNNNGHRAFFIDNNSMAHSALAYGQIQFVTGANAGLTYPIFNNYLDSTNTYMFVVLLTLLTYDPAVGDQVILLGGCDKSQSTCSAVYNNFRNFGGEPAGKHWMPTNDFYLSSPVQ